MEGGRYGITCNAIVPGIIGTEAFHFANPAMNERIANRTVQGRRAGGHRERDLLPLLRPRQLHHRRRVERQRRRRAVRVLMRIEHVAVWTHDLDGLRDFYERWLGGVPGDRYERPETGYTSYFLSFDDGARLELDVAAGHPRDEGLAARAVHRTRPSRVRARGPTSGSTRSPPPSSRRPASRCSTARAARGTATRAPSSTPTATGSS